MAASGARGAVLDQRPDQAQQLLVLGAVAAADEEIPTPMSLALPPEEALGSCRTNTRPEAASRTRCQRSPSTMR